MEPLLCPWEPAYLLFFSSNVPALVHYSHLVSMLAAIIAAAYVFFSAPQSPVARLFAAMVTAFSFWTLLDIILWSTNRPDIVLFAWSLQIILEPLTYAAAFYLYYYFLLKRWPPFWLNTIVAFMFIPFVTLLHTRFNLGELYLSTCEVTEGPLAKYITHMVHALFILAIGFMSAHVIPKITDRRERLTALAFGFGLLFFLLSFSSGTIIGSFTDDWALSQYGLFGMPIFAGFIAFCIIKFKAFNVKVLTAEILVVALGIGVISLVALQSISNVRIVASITFFLLCIVGFSLIRNVRKEVQQRELIEQQRYQLELANQKQESLLHFISHEIKGYLTEGQNAFAGIIEGDFGEPSPQIRTISTTALGKMRQGVSTVMDILDASNLKKGTVTFKHEEFDVGKLLISVVEKLRSRAEEKGLQLGLQMEVKEEYPCQGDGEKISEHVLRNLIDNAIRYTPSGSVLVSLKNVGSHVRLSIRDTGVGIHPDDMHRLFTEGGKGKDSVKVNVDSTGYGLYIAKQIIEAHKGTIRAQSDGVGKGSEFVVELPRVKVDE